MCSHETQRKNGRNPKSRIRYWKLNNWKQSTSRSIWFKESISRLSSCKSYVLRRVNLHIYISISSFGEVAIKLESSRASTVFAVENTHLLYMSEAAYIQLLDPYLS